MTAPSDPVLGTSPIQLLTLGRRRYAFGLRWTSATARASLTAEALAAAGAERAGFVVLHRGFNQFGLAPDLEAGGLFANGWGPAAGAAAIADAAGPATLAAFPLDDGRWLVLAVDRKGILPDGDAIVADEAAAKARIEALIAQSPTAWRRKFVPADWKISESRTVNPRVLLARARAPRLMPPWLVARRFRLMAGASAAVAVLAALVALAVRPWLVAPPAIPFAAPPPKPVAAIWTPAGLTIDRCLAALRNAQRFIAVPGWRAVKLTCEGDAVAIAFQRASSGQIAALSQLVPQARLSDDGRSASLAFPLAALPRVSAASAFAERERYQRVGLDLAQRLNGTFALQTAARRTLPGEARAGAPNQAWSQLGWSYRTGAPAIVWAGAIARLGSLSVDTLSFSPADNLWQLTGTLYAGN